MNKETRELLKRAIQKGQVQRYTQDEVDQLFDYLDTLEAACQFAYKPMTDYALEHHLANLREALARSTK